MINIILENEFILFSLISMCIVMIFTQIATIEFKFILKFIGDITKNIFAIFILSRITISSVNVISKSSKEPSILNILNIFYENYIWIVLILIVFYIMDKLTEKKVSENYSKYAVYSANLFIYTTLTLNESVWINGFSCLILMILKLYSYKKNINNKYKKLANSMGKTRYIFYIVSGLILTYTSLFVLKGRHNYEILIILGLFFYLLVFKKYRLEKKDETESEVEINELSDKEVNSKDKLFKTRKKELLYILSYFKKEVSEIEEPFAMSISGKWGEGKSSFTNVLKKELEDEYIIFDIQPMVTDTREGLIKYFFSNLEKQFIYYGLSVGNGSSIENYFSSILKLIDSKGLISIKQEIKNISSTKFDLREKKEDLQKDIKSLIDESNKKILIVVDDFDRVDNEVKYSILTFIKEIINFNGIKSLILLDYSTLKKDGESKITYEFLDKFINKRFELSKLSTEEILEYYETILVKEKDNELKDNLNIELDDLRINIKIEIDKIKRNIKAKVNKTEDDLYELRKDKDNKNESNIKIKEKMLETLKDLNSSINSGVENTRKIKRIIREIQDKVEYTKNLYSKFGFEDKAELIKNIDVKNTIITMVLIKVLYEEEFDNILREKDLLNYIKRNKGAEVYELIYCTIFKESDKFNHMYTIDIVDTRLIEFINNIFTCINTPEDIFDFKRDKEKLLKIISCKPINFNNSKTVFQNIEDVYNKIDYYNLTDKMENISEYISEELKNGNIEIFNAIKIIKTGREIDGLVKYNKKYIRTLRQYLESKKIVYNESSQKQRDEVILNMCVTDIINSNKNNIAFVLAYKSIQFDIKSYYDIMEDLLSYDSIERINNYAIGLLKDIKLEDSLSEIEKFSELLEVEQIYDDNLDLSKIDEEIKEMIEILKDIEFIENSIKKSKLERGTMNYNQMDYKEIIEELEEIKENISNKFISDRQLYDFTLRISRIAYTLYSKYIERLTPEIINVLDEISLSISSNFDLKNKDTETLLRGIQLRILGIKKRKGQLKRLN